MNITNKTHLPREFIGTYELPTRATDIFVFDNYLYLTAFGGPTNEEGGLLIFDVSEKTKPVLLSHFNFNKVVGSDLWGIDVNNENTVVFLCSYILGLIIIDVSDKFHPRLIGRYNISSGCYDVKVEGNVAFVTANLDGMIVLDVSDLEHPRMKQHPLPLEEPFRIVVMKNFAFVLDAWKYFKIVDLGEIRLYGTPTNEDVGNNYAIQVKGTDSSYSSALNTFHLSVIQKEKKTGSKVAPYVPINYLGWIFVSFSIFACAYSIMIFSSFLILTAICFCIFCFALVIILGVLVCYSFVFREVKKISLDDGYKKFDEFDFAQKSEMKSKLFFQEGKTRIKINPSLFRIKQEELKVRKMIGRGGSGSIVFMCIWNGIEVAFKSYFCNKASDMFASQEDFDSFEKEIEIMSSIRHPHCLRFYGCSVLPPRIGIVMEYCPLGDLRSYLEKIRNDLSSDDREYYLGFSMLNRIRILRETCEAIHYLHNRKVVHRDVKSENILLDNQLSAKLIDFGISKVATRMSMIRTTMMGTVTYMSPEIVLGKTYNEKCDVFSLAIVMWEVITSNFNPYGERGGSYGVEYKVANDASFRPSLVTLKKCIRKGKDELHDSGDDTILVEFENVICDLIRKSWADDVDERPSCSDLISSLQVATKYFREL